MTDPVNAFVNEPFSLANTETSYLAGAIIRDMPAGQFADLEAIGLVRRAGDAELSDAAAPLAPLAPLAPTSFEPAAD